MLLCLHPASGRLRIFSTIYISGVITACRGGLDGEVGMRSGCEAPRARCARRATYVPAFAHAGRDTPPPPPPPSRTAGRPRPYHPTTKLTSRLMPRGRAAGTSQADLRPATVAAPPGTHALWRAAARPRGPPRQNALRFHHQNAPAADAEGKKAKKKRRRAIFTVLSEPEHTVDVTLKRLYVLHFDHVFEPYFRGQEDAIDVPETGRRAVDACGRELTREGSVGGVIRAMRVLLRYSAPCDVGGEHSRSPGALGRAGARPTTSCLCLQRRDPHSPPAPSSSCCRCLGTSS